MSAGICERTGRVLRVQVNKQKEKRKVKRNNGRKRVEPGRESNKTYEHTLYYYRLCARKDREKTNAGERKVHVGTLI